MVGRGWSYLNPVRVGRMEEEVSISSCRNGALSKEGAGEKYLDLVLPLPTNILPVPHRDQLETGKGPQETILQGLPAGAQNTVEKVRE